MKSVPQVFILALASLFFGFNAAKAQEHSHPNTVEIKRESKTVIQFDFSLNLPAMLHRMLAPQTSYAAFLKAQAELSDPALDRELDRLSTALSEKAFLILPSGSKLRLKQWQWPDKQSLRGAFMSSFILLNLPQKTNAHIDTLRVTASIETKATVGRVQLQLQLPSAMNPILVVVQSDQFWLTDQIPMSILVLD